MPDRCNRPVQHRLTELPRQRLFQIACGYEDQDDADTLRHDPLFKLACGRLPEDSPLALAEHSASQREHVWLEGDLRFLVEVRDIRACADVLV